MSQCCHCAVAVWDGVLQLGELELLLPPPPSSAAVVGFVLKFLAGYGNTLQSSPAFSASSSSSTAAGTLAEEQGAGGSAGDAAEEAVLASFGTEPRRDKALGVHRMVRVCLSLTSVLPHVCCSLQPEAMPSAGHAVRPQLMSVQGSTLVG